MKKRYSLLLLVLLSGISQQAFAQFPLGRQKAKLSGIQVTIGEQSDLYNNLSAEGLFSMLKPNQDVSFNINEYTADGGYTAEMWGSSLGVNLIFNPKRSDGSIRSNHEIRIGADLALDREVMINVTARNLGGPADYVGLCVIENNFNLEAAYIFKAPISRFLEVYAGPGVNFGGTFGNRFLFLGDPTDNGDRKARNSNYLRGNLIAGARVGGEHLFVMMEGRFGAGAQIVHNGKANLLTNYGIQLGIGYRW